MENRTPKNRYNGGAATDPGKSAGKPDALKLLESAMDKRAGDIAQTATDMFRFMSMASAMLPNMELDALRSACTSGIRSPPVRAATHR